MSEDKKPQDPNPRFACEGCSVLLDINDGDRLVFARLSSGAILKIGNKNYSLKPLIGAPFGSLFQVETGEDGSFLSRILPIKQESNSNNVMDDSRDNREIVDNNEAQNLTGEEIEAMRREGAKGDEIIEALIANSKTFDKKFQLSQEKYKLKKQKKYAPKLLLRRPFARRYLFVRFFFCLFFSDFFRFSYGWISLCLTVYVKLISRNTQPELDSYE